MVNKFIRYIVYALFTGMSSLPLIAYGQQTPDISISPTRGSLKTTFTITVGISGTISVPQPNLEDEGDFTLRYMGPEQRISIINGTLTQEKKFNYQAKPKREGNLTLPMFAVKVSGTTLHTPPRTIEVSQTSLDTQQSDEDDVRIEDSVSQSEVFVGQQLLLTTELFTTSPLKNIQLETSSRANFWVEPIKPEERDQGLHRGATVSILRFKNILFPLSSGSQKIEPTVISALASRSRVGDLFDQIDPFGNNFMRGLFAADLEPITIATKPTLITVLPLPEIPTELKAFADKPILVGETTIQGSLDKVSTDPNDEAILTVRIDTRGNSNPLQDLPLSGGDDIELVRETQGTKKIVQDNALFSEYSATYRVIPKKNGGLTIPPISLLYFDPNSRSYQKTETTAFLLMGENVSETTRNPKGPSMKKDEETTPESSFAKKDPDLSDEDNSSTPLFSSKNIALAILTLTTIAGFLQFWFGRRKSSSTTAVVSQVVSTLPKSPFEALRFLQLIAEKATSNQTIGGLLEILAKNQPVDARHELSTAFALIEEAVYAPHSSVDQKLFEAARDTIWEYLRIWNGIHGN